MSDQQRLLLMGCGAVGGVIAGGLLRAGQQLTIVTHNEQITQAIGKEGLRVTTPEGAWTVPVTAHTHLEEVDGPFDAVYLAMKGTEVEQATRDVAGKLAINCTITTLGAVTGQLLGEMLQRAAIRRVSMAIISEALDVANAQGISLEPVGGTLDLQRLYLPPERRAGGSGLDLVPKHAVILAVGIKFRRLKSSMLQSLERGRRPEIDFLNGYVAEQGREKGVDTPVNAALTAMVHEIEAGTRTISPDNLGELPH